MKLVDMKVIDFIKEVDSPSPAPGGGSVSALSLSLAASLARMVGHLTLNKKKYAELSSDIKTKFEASFDKFSILNEELVRLIDEDTNNFNLFMAAMKMPKETDDEKEIRKNKMHEASLKATETPARMLELSIDILKDLSIFVEYGNQNALSDVAVAALLAEAGGKGAILNIKINLSSFDDKSIVDNFRKKCEDGFSEIEKLSKNIKDRVDSVLEK